MANKIRARITSTASRLYAENVSPAEGAICDDDTGLWYMDFEGWHDLYQFLKDANHTGPSGDYLFAIEAISDDPTGAIISLEIYDYYRE